MVVRLLALSLAVGALGGCADWFEKDTAGPCTQDAQRVEVTPSVECLALSLTVQIDPDGGAHRIEGKNTCTDALTVTTADGGGTTFAVGAIIVIPLDPEPSTTEGSSRRWTFQATLGSEPVTITATNGC